MSNAAQKPPKPYPTYPLFAHARGYWAKKIDKKQISFGPWAWPNEEQYVASWKSALETYQKFLEDVAHGRSVEERPDSATVKLLSDAYLTHQHNQMEKNAIRPIHFQSVKSGVERFRNQIGRETTLAYLEKDGVPLLRTWLNGLDIDYGWHAYNRHVAIIRAMFKWAAHPVDGILKRPFHLLPLLVKKGDLLRRREVKAKVVERGAHCYTPAELWAMIHAGNIHYTAMALLGYFCAYGNEDCSQLTFEHVNFDPDPALQLPAGWGVIHFPRPKTEIERAAAIPPIVCEAIRASIAVRPKPRLEKWAKRVFITKAGLPFTRQKKHRREDGVVEKVVNIDSVGIVHKRARARVRHCPIHGHMLNLRSIGGVCPDCGDQEKKPGLQALRMLGFYTFRHSALTYAAGTSTPEAIALWEGHTIAGVRSHYVAHVDIQKLTPIADALLTRLLSRSRSIPVDVPPAPTAAASEAA